MESLKRDEERELASEEKIEQISQLGGGEITRKRRRKRRRKERGNSCGFLFSGIPEQVRISELKERLRETGARLTFLTWLGNKRAAKVFFQVPGGEKTNTELHPGLHAGWRTHCCHRTSREV